MKGVAPMEERQQVHHRKHPITEIGRTVPANFKFGIIVAIAVLWSQFLKSLLDALFSFLGLSGEMVSSLLTAAIASILGYIVLVSYWKIRFRLKKIKV
jgi:hypothetical protein